MFTNEMLGLPIPLFLNRELTCPNMFLFFFGPCLPPPLRGAQIWPECGPRDQLSNPTVSSKFRPMAIVANRRLSMVVSVMVGVQLIPLTGGGQKQHCFQQVLCFFNFVRPPKGRDWPQNVPPRTSSRTPKYRPNPANGDPIGGETTFWKNHCFCPPP